MKQIIKKTSQAGLSGLGNALLTATATSVTIGCVAVTSMYLLKHAEENEELITLKCAVGISRPDCPDIESEREMSALRAQIAEAKKKLGAIGRLENAVDSVTLFDTHDIGSGLSVTVGTVYSKLLDADQTPNYFCYISLPDEGSVDRNVYIRQTGGDVPLSEKALAEAGINQRAFSKARQKCTPYLIEG